MYLLEKELDALGDWFAKTYPEGTLDAHAGKNKRNNEEYHIEFGIAGKHFGSVLIVPVGWEDQDAKFLEQFKIDFLRIQKEKITKAVKSVGII